MLKRQRERLLFTILISALIVFLYVNDNSTEVQSPANTRMTSKDQFAGSSQELSINQPRGNKFNFQFPVPAERRYLNAKESVVKFRNLVKKLEHCPENCERVNPGELMHLPKDILIDPTFQRIVERNRKSMEGCNKDSSELKTGMIHHESMIFINDNRHHLSICFNAKAGSTSFALYSKVLALHNDINNKLEQFTSNRLRVKLEHESNLNLLQGKNRKMSDSNLKVVVVRHPFQRLASAYNDKINGSGIPEWMKTTEYFQSMLSMSLVPDDKTVKYFGKPKIKLECSHKLKGTAGKMKPVFNSLREEIPSFRGFVLGILEYRRKCEGKLECLKEMDRHMLPQVLRCGPCVINYDAILKIETLQEDISLIGRVLGIEYLWSLQQQIIKNNERENHEFTAPEGTLTTNAAGQYSYVEYMNQLAPHEMDLLFEAYQNDFDVFGYDPCLDITNMN